MADISRLPTVATQIRLVAGLRWRTLRNGLRRKGNRLDLIGMIFAGIFASVLVFGLSLAFFAGAKYFLTEGPPSRIALLFWAIFVFWQLIPVLAAGFGANFEFRTLLRFPLDLRAFYLIGLAYGFADLAALASTCWLFAILFATAAVRPSALPAMILASALFLLFNLTLERLLGSWFERLFARRRTRELFLGIFVLLMISLQFIGPALHRYGAVLPELARRTAPYFAPFPPSLAGRAVADSLQQNWSGALIGFAGLAAYAALVSLFLWHRFAAQYSGEELSESSSPARRREKVERTAPGADALRNLSPQIAAVVRKEFRYLTRNGFALLNLLFPPALVLLFTTQFAGPHPTAVRRGLSPQLFFPAMMAYIVLMMITPAYNCFAFEGRGIQTYFTAPLRFRSVFLGKNLVLTALLAVELAACITVFGYRVGLPPPPQLAATLIAIVFVVVGQFSIANWSSLHFPRKLIFGQMRNQRQSGMAVLIALGVQIVLAAVSAGILLAGRWTNEVWLPAEAFAALSAVALFGYFASLDYLSQLAETRKEMLIETLCR